MPYDSKTRTTKLPTTTSPDSEAGLDFETRRAAVDEEFIQSGPVQLLEAVYCDPCKAKVMDK